MSARCPPAEDPSLLPPDPGCDGAASGQEEHPALPGLHHLPALLALLQGEAHCPGHQAPSGPHTVVINTQRHGHDPTLEVLGLLGRAR